MKAQTFPLQKPSAIWQCGGHDTGCSLGNQGRNVPRDLSIKWLNQHPLLPCLSWFPQVRNALSEALSESASTKQKVCRQILPLRSPGIMPWLAGGERANFYNGFNISCSQADEHCCATDRSVWSDCSFCSWALFFPWFCLNWLLAAL